MKKYLNLITAGMLAGCVAWGAAEAATVHSDVKKLTDYLYEVTYDDYDWDEANHYFSKRFNRPIAGACSGVQNGTIRGRNMDWYYDGMAEFVIKTPAKNGRHATIGVVSQSEIPAVDVDAGKDSYAYKILPFKTSDGINDAGLCIQVNVVPNEDCSVKTTGTNPKGKDMMVSVVQRYVLDYATNVDEAISMMKQFNLYAPHSEVFDQEVHFLLSDSKKSVVVEFVNNQLVVVDNQHIMTNYYNAFPELTPHANGVERAAILKAHFNEGKTPKGMMNLMKKVRFSNAYNPKTKPFWYSDFAEGKLTIHSKPEDFKDTLAKEQAAFKEFKMGKNIWITNHTSVYDTKNLTLDICPQETDSIFHFNLVK